MRTHSHKSLLAIAPLQGALRAFSVSLLRRVQSRAPYSPREVRARLREDPSSREPRTAAVHAAAAEIGAWMHLLPQEAAREDHLGLAASRLPTVVFWFCRGMQPQEIGRRLTPFGESCYGNRAIDAASTLIAELLNRRAAGERGGTPATRI
jgi:hypothetical protein